MMMISWMLVSQVIEVGVAVLPHLRALFFEPSSTYLEVQIERTL